MSSFKIEIASFFVGRGARGAREVRGGGQVKGSMVSKFKF